VEIFKLVKSKLFFGKKIALNKMFLGGVDVAFSGQVSNVRNKATKCESHQRRIRNKGWKVFAGGISFTVSFLFTFLDFEKNL
jgi:hypothetical protein